jgi:molybdopterin-binding protein
LLGYQKPLFLRQPSSRLDLLKLGGLYLKQGEAEMNISARNTLKGTIKDIVHGEINTEVTIELPGGQEIVSVITKASAERLNIAQGREAYAVIKSSDVLIAIESLESAERADYLH